jgi:hypothetical protein
MHEKLAHKVMKLLLQGDDEVLRILQSQYQDTAIISEKYSDFGFYINYHLKKTSRSIPALLFKTTFIIDDLDGFFNNGEQQVGFILYIRDGYLSCLEGYTMGVEKWPDDDLKIILTYTSGNPKATTVCKRDYSSLQKVWKLS